jgi:hypothetical protein
MEGDPLATKPRGNRTSAQANGARAGIEQLSVLSVAIVLAVIGVAVHALWIVAIVVMAVLWGMVAADLRRERGRGVMAEVVTTVVDEAKGVAHALSEAPHGEAGDDADHADDSSAASTASKRELYEAAKDAGIEGRSSMTKDELRAALDE